MEKKEVKEKAQTVDATQAVEQDAYVPTYRIKPEFKKAVLQAIGDQPFNNIAGLIDAVKVEVMDHTTLDQVIKALGQFPYIRVEGVITNINSYVEQIVPED